VVEATLREAAVAELRVGGVVGVPTDTVYGIAADPFLRDAVARLFEVKRRPGIKPIPILASGPEQAATIGVLDDRTRRACRRHWPGGLTVIVNRVPGLPEWIGDPDRDTVGVRVPDHPVALELLAAYGPLAVTSANRSGEPPAPDHVSARASLGDDVTVYLPGRGANAGASTVVDLTGPEPRVLREGPVTWEG
jgi:tRNA threonylcarbamoyl adenosine modification protein (Sua5/YciO/YrdC/YwlC family)